MYSLAERRTFWRTTNLADPKLDPLKIFPATSATNDASDGEGEIAKLVFFAALPLAGGCADLCRTVARLHVHENILHVLLRAQIDPHSADYLARGFQGVTGSPKAVGKSVQFHDVENPGQEFKAIWRQRAFDASELDPLGFNSGRAKVSA